MTTKICSKCKIEQTLTEFSKDKSRPDGYCYHCNNCRRKITHNVYKSHNPGAKCMGRRTGPTFDRIEYSRLYRINDRPRNAAYSAKRKAQKLKATPKWYEHDDIIKLYREARRISEETGIPYQVDHIVPLQNPNVSGLHCFANLQILTAEENRIKNNTFK